MVFHFCLALHEPPSAQRSAAEPTTTDGGVTTEWSVDIWSTSNPTTNFSFKLTDPFIHQQTPPQDLETSLEWYLESHANDPFEKSKADLAADCLASYGCQLATQIANSGLLPKNGDIELQITTSAVSEYVGRDLHQLHWEVLEDTSLWPATYRFESVSIVRSIRQTSSDVHSKDTTSEGKVFRILLVSARPGQQDDIEYQLVSRFLVAIVNQISTSRTGVKTTLKILRPPTWQEFSTHLCMHENYYDIVHFDMHGKVKNASKGNATWVILAVLRILRWLFCDAKLNFSATLAFCKPLLNNALEMKEHHKTGREIGQVLVSAGVKTVIINACRSATSKHHTAESNLARVLVDLGVQSVLAMAYKSNDEAVEISMNAFYQAILIKRAAIHDAARIARLALMKNRSRRASYMYKVQLSDYIVPVFYTSMSSSALVGMTTDVQSTNSILSFLSTTLTSLRLASSATSVGDPSTTGEQELIGRDADAMSLENLLSTTRLVLLHGDGGCGKTALLRYLSNWWKASGWIVGSAHVYLEIEELLRFEDVLQDISYQLGLNSSTEEAIVSKLTSRKYLLIFDGEDCLDSPIPEAKTNMDPKFTEQLKSFIDACTREESIVVVASRFNTSAIANIKFQRQKYHLTGLSVLDSVNLLQKVAIENLTQLPERLRRREHIEFLRRVCILLEGNPEAIRMVLPTFKTAQYDGEVLLDKLLYGTCDNIEHGWERAGRFAQTVICSTIGDSISRTDRAVMNHIYLGIFWTLLPQDVAYYNWFIYLSVSPEYPTIPIFRLMMPEFREIIEEHLMVGYLRQRMWPEIKSKLLRAGFISNAIITNEDGTETPCYHLHPIFTLICRKVLDLETCKSAYVRQSMFWETQRDGKKFASVVWDQTEQHEDYLHNGRALALDWSVEDFSLDGVAEHPGPSLFDTTYTAFISSILANNRQLSLYLPIFWRHLVRVMMVVGATRPEGKPTVGDLNAILSSGWAIYSMENDVKRKKPVVDAVLRYVDIYRGPKSASAVLTPPQEHSWFTFRYAEACLVQEAGFWDRAKDLYARNLADEPATTEHTPHGMYTAIRRVLYNNLTDWNGCVFNQAWREGDVPAGMTDQLNDAMKQLSGSVKPGHMIESVFEMLKGDTDAIDKLTLRDQCLFALQREKTAMSKFCPLVHQLLDMSLYEPYADVIEGGGTGSGTIEFLLKQLASKDTKSGDLQAQVRVLESMFHGIAGNSTAAVSALSGNLPREAISSTTSTRWQSLSDFHMQSYAQEVLMPETPNYRNGLRHLEEWWNQHHGTGIPKLELCYGYLKFVDCYHALDRITEAARTIIKCADVVPTMIVNDIADGDSVEGFEGWLYREFDQYVKLKIFMEPKSAFIPPEIASDLSLQERTRMRQIMKKAREEVSAEAGAESNLIELKENLKAMLATLNLQGNEELIERSKKTIEDVETGLRRQQEKKANRRKFALFGLG